jgi:hypothetical protein
VSKQIETTLDNFARRESAKPWMVLTALIVASLLILVVLSAVAKDWMFTALAAVAFVAALAFSVRQIFSLRQSWAKADQRRIDWETAQPDIQRQNLNIEVLELSKILEVESAQISDLQTAYIVAEDLALRQIQQDENVPLMRHVTVGRAPFDAVLVKEDVISCIDVTFLVVPDLRQEKIDAMIKKIALVKKTFALMNMKTRVRLMMVMVTQLTPEDDDRLRTALDKQRFGETPVDIDIRLLDFESLQRIYVTDQA